MSSTMLPPSRKRLVANNSEDAEGNGLQQDHSAMEREPLFIDTSFSDEDEQHYDYGKHRKIRNPLLFCYHHWSHAFVSVPRSFVCTFRTALTLGTMLAMLGVSLGIASGVYVALAPAPDRIIVLNRTIVRSDYSFDIHNNATNNHQSVLGKIPLAVQPKNVYRPSQLESQILQSGRQRRYDLEVRYDHPLEVRTRTPQPQLSPGDVAMALSPLSLLGTVLFHKQPRVTIDYEDPSNTRGMPSGCDLWKLDEPREPGDDQLPGPKLLKRYKDNLVFYYGAQRQWKRATRQKDDEYGPTMPEWWDLRNASDHPAVCASLEVHSKHSEGGLAGFFHKSRSLSELGTGELLEPLAPPFRNPKLYCGHSSNDDWNRTPHRPGTPQEVGLVHDFASVCRHRIHANRRTVLVDLGNSLAEPPAHANGFYQHRGTPTLHLLALYGRFGILFDERWVCRDDNRRNQNRNPPHPGEAVPWLSALPLPPVVNELGSCSTRDPWAAIRERYRPDDFVVVVLSLEDPVTAVKLARQILLDDYYEPQNNNATTRAAHRLADLIDAVYFQPRPTMKEGFPLWRDTTRGSIQDALEFFQSLRERGISAHFWV